MTQKEIVEEVMEKEPVALYQVLSAMNYQEGTDQGQEDAKRLFAPYILNLYIEGKLKAPESIGGILDDIIDFGERMQTEEEEIAAIEEFEKHKAYIAEHNLEWVLQVFMDYTQGSVEELDKRLDYEFVYIHHHDQGQEFDREDPESAIRLFTQWLEAGYSVD